MKFLILSFLVSSTAFGDNHESAASLLGSVLHYVDLVSQLVMALCVLATIVARLLPSEKDDKAVSEAVKKAQNVLRYLPTFGINPRTKELEKALEQLNAKAD